MTGFERWNLILVLLVIQMVQVLLLAVAVFVFFLLFGSLIMIEPEVQRGVDRRSTHAPCPAVATSRVA